jgi:hypothetical protein
MARPVRHRTEAEKFLECLGYGLLLPPIKTTGGPALFFIYTVTTPNDPRERQYRPKFSHEFPPGMSPAQIQEVMHSRTFSK